MGGGEESAPDRRPGPDADLQISRLKEMTMVPVRITFRDIDALPAVEARVRRRVARLERTGPTLRGARVIIEGPHARPDGHHVRLELDVDGGAVVADQAGVELADALADVFHAARRELRDLADRRDAAGSGKVVALSRGHRFGYIAAEDGRKVFFDGSSVKGGLGAVYTGARVRFREEGGEAQLVLVA
jgi:ribosome-associated translation inhibitor RaiA